MYHVSRYLQKICIDLYFCVLFYSQSDGSMYYIRSWGFCVFFFFFNFPISMQNIGCIGVRIEGNQMNWFSVKKPQAEYVGFWFLL